MKWFKFKNGEAEIRYQPYDEHRTYNILTDLELQISTRQWENKIVAVLCEPMDFIRLKQAVLARTDMIRNIKHPNPPKAKVKDKTPPLTEFSPNHRFAYVVATASESVNMGFGEREALSFIMSDNRKFILITTGILKELYLDYAPKEYRVSVMAMDQYNSDMNLMFGIYTGDDLSLRFTDFDRAEKAMYNIYCKILDRIETVIAADYLDPVKKD